MVSLQVFAVLLLSVASSEAQSLESCIKPEDFTLSRSTRLHHSCETNQNRCFAIETKNDSLCIFYSVDDIAIFGAETKFEIKVDGSWDYEQIGADDFHLVNKTLIFGATTEDVKIIIKKKGEALPTISSVLILDGAIPEGEENSEVKQEYCQRNCGRQGDSVPTIIGGIEAPEGFWPWNAAIYRRLDKVKLGFRCGATIINKRTLITTATCLSSQNQALQGKSLLVAVKQTTLYSPSSKHFAVKQVKLHEKFGVEESTENQFKHDYNVGLLITEADIPFSLHLNAICLPDSDKFVFKGKQGVVVGWGYDKDHQLSSKLQQLDVPTFQYLDCFYRNREFFGGHSSKRNFCAGYKEKGICSGDSGGGLYIKTGNKFILYGLSSFANCKCVKETMKCEIFDEGIFVNTAAYIQWIHNNMF